MWGFFLTVTVYPCDERNNQLNADITEAGLHAATQRQYTASTQTVKTSLAIISLPSPRFHSEDRCPPKCWMQTAPTTSTPKSSRCICVCVHPSVCVSSSVGGQGRARRDLVLGGPAISSHSFLNLCSNVTGDKSSLPARSALFENISHLRTQNTACSIRVCVQRGSSGCTEGASCHLNYPSTCGVNMCRNVCLCVCLREREFVCVWGGLLWELPTQPPSL